MKDLKENAQLPASLDGRFKKKVRLPRKRKLEFTLGLRTWVIR